MGRDTKTARTEIESTIEETLTLNDLAKLVGRMRTAQGWGPVTMDNLDSRLLMVVSEICEAQLELRLGHDVRRVVQLQSPEADSTPDQPTGFPIEIADAIFRLLDICYCLVIDIDNAAETKMIFNFSNPSKRGRKY